MPCLRSIFLPNIFLPGLIDHQAVRLARELAASSSSRREPRRGTEGCPQIAPMGRRRVSHKEHKDRKEGGRRGACLSGPMAPVPGFLPPPALCSLRSLWLALSGFSIPPSIMLPPSFCRRPKTSARTRAAPATRAETHPAGRSGWPRNPSTCSPAALLSLLLCPPPSALRALRSTNSPLSPWLQKNQTVPFPLRPPVLSSPPCATHAHQFRAVCRGLSPVRRPGLRRTLSPAPRPRSTRRLAPTALVLPLFRAATPRARLPL